MPTFLEIRRVRRMTPSTSVALLAVLFIPLQLLAQAPATHHHYKLIDFGTFGGLQSYTAGTSLLTTGLELNNSGVLVGYADTAIPDPFPAFCFNADCLVAYGFQWQDGVASDLGSLRRGWSSTPVAISANGIIVGYAQNGATDPLTDSPEDVAVLWQNGRIRNLGTLPEGGYESSALAVNSAGQVVGAALNTIPDANPLFIYPIYPVQATQTRAFIWDGGEMRDLGTLGGTDAIAAAINENGQVMGWSYTGSTQPSGCGPALLAVGSFIWDRERGMRSVGDFGDTCTLAYGQNNRGQVVGYSVPAGSQYGTRAFLSQDGAIQDLGGAPLGTCTFAFAINGAGQAAGGVCVGPYFHAALWTGIGQITDLGTLGSDPCSNATDINAIGQVVGGSISLAECEGEGNATDAFLWENGSIVDLNALVPPDSPLYLVFPDHISDLGEISGNGVDASGNNHAFLLIPCDANHPFIEGCDYRLVDMSSVAKPAVAPGESHDTPMVWRQAIALNHRRSLLRLSLPNK